MVCRPGVNVKIELTLYHAKIADCVQANTIVISLCSCRLWVMNFFSSVELVLHNLSKKMKHV